MLPITGLNWSNCQSFYYTPPLEDPLLQVLHYAAEKITNTLSNINVTYPNKLKQRGMHCSCKSEAGKINYFKHRSATANPIIYLHVERDNLLNQIHEIIHRLVSSLQDSQTRLSAQQKIKL